MTTIALDVHVHIVPAGHLAGADGVTWNPQTRDLCIDAKPITFKDLFEPALLLAWMDHQRIERAWISVPPLVYRQQLDQAAGAGWTARLNEGLAAVAADHPGRLAPLYHLPVEHPHLAARMARALGASRYALCAGGESDAVFSEPAFAPLWAELEAARAFVFLHPGRCCDGRLRRFYLENLLGNPHETSVAVAHLVFGGVLERHPHIRFCLAHGGGTVPMMAGRWQHGFNIALPELKGMRGDGPLLLLRRFYADCLTHGEQTLDCAADLFGLEHLIFGSDWPFAMGIADPHGYLAGLRAGLAEQLRRAPRTLG
jgi:aminocarboxymuconate-semialdehyde decarboxylase